MKPWQIRAARAALGWSLNDLASRSGVTRNTINRYETGRFDMKSATRDRVQEALEAAGVRFTATGVELDG